MYGPLGPLAPQLGLAALGRDQSVRRERNSLDRLLVLLIFYVNPSRDSRLARKDWRICSASVTASSTEKGGIGDLCDEFFQQSLMRRQLSFAAWRSLASGFSMVLNPHLLCLPPTCCR